MSKPIEINKFIAKQLDLYKSDKFSLCKNRKGIRKATAELLEQYYCTLVHLLGLETSIEIGAHEATFSKTVKSLSPNINCFAFEANPYVYEKYRFELESLNIIYKNLAISNTNRDILLNIPISRHNAKIEIDNPISSIYKRNRNGFEYKTVPVKSHKLKSLFDNSQKKALWIDVEGSQLEVLESIGNLWSSIALIYIEIEDTNVWQNNYDKDSIYKMLNSLGYVEIMIDNIAKKQYNSAFIHQKYITNIITEIIEKYIKQLQVMAITY